MMKKIVAIDTETTGFDPVNDRVIQLAIIATTEHGVERWDQLINPGFPIPEQITELTKITNEMVADQPSEAMVMPKLAQLLTADTLLVAHNLPFDLKFINATLKRCGLPEFKGKFIDTLALSRLLFPGMANKLTDVAERLGVTLDNAHNAMADIEACYQVLQPLIKLAEGKNVAYENVVTEFDTHPLDFIPEGAQVVPIWTLPWNVSDVEFLSKAPKPFSYKSGANTAYYLNPGSGWMTVGPEFFHWSRNKRREVILNTNAQRLIDALNHNGALNQLASSGAMGPTDVETGRLLDGFHGAKTPVQFVREAYWAIHLEPAALKTAYPLAYDYLAVTIMQTKCYNPKHVYWDYKDKSLPDLTPAMDIPVPAVSPDHAGVAAIPETLRDEGHGEQVEEGPGAGQPPVGSPPMSAPAAGGGQAVCFDFDGVLADYTGWAGDTITDPPIAGAKEFVERIVKAGYKPLIHCYRHPVIVQDWLQQYGFPAMEIVDRKPVATLYIDYRGFRFDGSNWMGARDAVTAKGWAWSKPSPEHMEKSKQKEQQLKKLAKAQQQKWLKGLVCMAFDGVLSDSTTGAAPGAPIANAKDFVEGMIRSEYEPVIYTSRDPKAVSAWCDLYGFPVLRVLNSRLRENAGDHTVIRNNKVKVYIERHGFRFTGNNWDEAWELLTTGDTQKVCVKQGPYTTPNRLLFVDTETTGLSRMKNRIVQLGAILVENGKVLHEINEYMNPEGGDISQEAVEKTGIKPEDLASAPSQKHVLSQLRALMTPGTTLVCHNVPFDLGMITASFKREGIEPWSGEFICTLGTWRWLEKCRFDAEITQAIADHANGMPDAYGNVHPMQSGRLFNVCGILGIPFDEEECAHDALYDVRATMAVFNVLRLRWEALPDFDPRNFFAQMSNVKADWVPPGATLVTISAKVPEEVRSAMKKKAELASLHVPVEGHAEMPAGSAVETDGTQVPAAGQEPVNTGAAEVLGALFAKAKSITSDISKTIAVVVAPAIEQIKAPEEPKTKSITVSLLSHRMIDDRLKGADFIKVIKVQANGDEHSVIVLEEHEWAAEYLLVKRKFEKAEDLFKKVSHGLTDPSLIEWTETTMRSHGYPFYKGYDLVGTGEEQHKEYYFLVKEQQRQTIRTKLSSVSAQAKAASKTTKQSKVLAVKA